MAVDGSHVEPRHAPQQRRRPLGLVGPEIGLIEHVARKVRGLEAVAVDEQQMPDAAPGAEFAGHHRPDGPDAHDEHEGGGERLEAEAIRDAGEVVRSFAQISGCRYGQPSRSTSPLIPRRS